MRAHIQSNTTPGNIALSLCLYHDTNWSINKPVIASHQQRAVQELKQQQQQPEPEQQLTQQQQQQQEQEPEQQLSQQHQPEQLPEKQPTRLETIQESPEHESPPPKQTLPHHPEHIMKPMTLHPTSSSMSKSLSSQKAPIDNDDDDDDLEHFTKESQIGYHKQVDRLKRKAMGHM